MPMLLCVLRGVDLKPINSFAPAARMAVATSSTAARGWRPATHLHVGCLDTLSSQGRQNRQTCASFFLALSALQLLPGGHEMLGPSDPGPRACRLGSRPGRARGQTEARRFRQSLRVRRTKVGCLYGERRIYASLGSHSVCLDQ